MAEPTHAHGEPYERAIGAQHLRFEPPDLFVLTLAGEITEAEGREMLDDIHRLTRGGPGYFELVDMTRLRAVRPEARRLITRPPPPGAAPLLGAALHGAGFHMRVIASAIQRVLVMMGHSKVLPMAFVSTRAEAQAWIDARRRSSP
jgi:hypothetical protein